MIDKPEGEYRAACDSCTEECTDEYVNTFLEFIKSMKDEGWIIRKVDDDFHHFCNINCWEDFRNQND